MINDEFNNEAINRSSPLPQNWIISDLQTIAKEIYRYPTFYGMEHLNNGVPVIRGEHIRNDGTISHNWDNYWYISDEISKKYPRTVLDLDDIIMSVRGSVGKTGIIDQALLNSQLSPNCIKISLHKKQIFPKYVLFYSKSLVFQKFIAELSNSTTIQTIKASLFNLIDIPLPPLPEQHRIVEKIEELYTQLDAGGSSLKKVQSQLKRYRQAVLKAAIEGRLTQKWREDHKEEIEPASELIKRIKAEEQQLKDGKLKELTSLEDTPSLENLEGWAHVRIGNIVEFLDHKRIPVNKEERAKRRGNIPYYGANGRVDWINDYIFDEPLVLVVEDETFVGRQIPFCYKITGKTWVNNHAHVLKPKKFVDIDFLNYSLMFYSFTQLTSGITGRRKLTKFSLVNAPYNLPSKEEQLMIVSEIEQRLSQIDHLEQTIITSLRQAETLHQSILKRAFEGKLVPQDPNDEPASILLERIMAEKIHHAAKAKKGKTFHPKSLKRKIKNGN